MKKNKGNVGNHFTTEIFAMLKVQFSKIDKYIHYQHKMSEKFKQSSIFPDEICTRQKLLEILNWRAHHKKHNNQKVYEFSYAKFGTAKTLGEMLQNIQNEKAIRNLSTVSRIEILKIIESNFCDLVMNRLCIAQSEIKKGRNPQIVIEELINSFKSKKTRNAA